MILFKKKAFIKHFNFFFPGLLLMEQTAAKLCNSDGAPQLDSGVVQLIYRFLPDTRDLINCMAVNRSWLRAACTLNQLPIATVRPLKPALMSSIS